MKIIFVRLKRDFDLQNEKREYGGMLGKYRSKVNDNEPQNRRCYAADPSDMESVSTMLGYLWMNLWDSM